MAQRATAAGYGSQEPSVSPPAQPQRTSLPRGPVACGVCGHQDETLRAVIYPFVFSLLIVTFRRVFAGLWCRRHRLRMQTIASLITATLGWLGIPFGLAFTPWALFKLAKGGDQPAELNARMLTQLGEQKARSGDAEVAVRCLEASLQFRDDDSIRQRISDIRTTFGLSVDQGGCHRILGSVAALLLAAAGIGTIIGVFDALITGIFTVVMPDEVLIYVAILTWAPLLAMAFMGGLLLMATLEWALVRIRCRRLLVAIAVGLTVAVFALYSLGQGTAMTAYVMELLSGSVYESLGEALFVGVFTLLFGGVLWILLLTEVTGVPDVIYVVVMLTIALYFVTMGLAIAIRTTRWQKRLVT